MLNLILVEAALELVPKRILRHPSVRRNAKRRGKPPEETLLNRSIHHSAMSRLENSEKRGRPDIANVCLLETQGSPLNKLGKLPKLMILLWGELLKHPKQKEKKEWFPFM